MSEDLEYKRFAWLRSGFDIEGIAAALAAWMAGILLGILWGPLFWLGFAAAVIILLATRRSVRAAPQVSGGIVAPCDGIVVSVERETPPPELRMDAASALRVRISSSPAATNRLYAPISGDLASMIVEAGEPGMALAWRPGDQGLARGYITLDGDGGEVGIVLASGGLGPRIDIEAEAGDKVKQARSFGKRRLGGWCDLYLPAGTEIIVRSGQNLLGGETLLSAGKPQSAAQPVPTAAADPGDDDYDDDVWEVESSDEDITSGDIPAPDPEGENAAETDSEDDAAALFARLRKAAEDQS